VEAEGAREEEGEKAYSGPYTYYVPNLCFLARLRAVSVKPRLPGRILEACVSPPAARAVRLLALFLIERGADGGGGGGPVIPLVA